MDTRALTSGNVLAGRYRLEDLISESHDAFTWRAADQTLNRSVCIQAMPAHDPRVDAFLEAARRSTVVTDPRFLRILDIVEDERDQAYLVREWARAVSLDRILRQSQLPNRRSATITSEVAEAMADAHESDVHHLYLGPRTVLIKDSGAVRITGLAVDQALRGTPAADHPIGYEEQVDVEAIGRLLYACLARRWPGGRRDGLKGAPTEHGRLLRPRQVRAGVSRDVDTVCDRILGTPPRHGAQPLRSARDIAQELRLAGDDDVLVTDDQPSLIGSSPGLFSSEIDLVPIGPPPAINPPKAKPAALRPKPPTRLQRSRAAALHATKGDRKWIAGGIAILLLVSVSIGVVLGRQSEAPLASDEPTTTSNQPAIALQPLRITGATDFDPEGTDGGENPEEAALAVDGKRATVWPTLSYVGRADLGGLKTGVGLLVDLGEVRTVASVDVTLQDGPTNASIYAADPTLTHPPTTSPSDGGPSQFIEGQPFRNLSGGRPQLLEFPEPVETRWVLVWLTELPLDYDGDYRGRIAEIAVRGRP